MVRPCGRRAHVGERVAFRRSTAAILGPITVSSFTGPETCISRDPGSIGAAFHPMLSKPLKAGPSSGPDGDPASWDEVTSLACRRRLPAPPTERLRKTPSVNGDGWEYSPEQSVRQVYNLLFWTWLPAAL